ncbi:hypothetical protein JHK82_027020 [Glycine max]|uniref:Uncharacterized protein n=2 Tax=Glycine subgen. Soja TaxID=1462606 RepID=K7LHN2_SOYBN|nr:hypothetical protein JHK87_026903 [Glycine soja]KAG4996206.1 hypothetical protein JHK85_027645 [Glycine max]KAG5003010.1 hypothetical protein JHK86_027149 [Glycine max]KAG5126185.1 hypothetical protein JHK82_027020 [Glycine max]KAG5150782.1 hypothetical protein JHK84_027254 [Glycine max]
MVAFISSWHLNTWVCNAVPIKPLSLTFNFQQIKSSIKQLSPGDLLGIEQRLKPSRVLPKNN